MDNKTIPEHSEIVELAGKFNTKQSRALFSLLYLTAGRLNELLPKPYIRRQKVKREDGKVVHDEHGKAVIESKWRDYNSPYPGLRKADIKFEKIGDREFMVITMLNQKNRTVIEKSIPVPIDKEGGLVQLVKDYINSLGSDAVLFPISGTTARNRIEDVAGFNPHHLRKVRLTHLVKSTDLSEEYLVRYAGWSDNRPSKHYVRLGYKDIARRM